MENSVLPCRSTHPISITSSSKPKNPIHIPSRPINHALRSSRKSTSKPSQPRPAKTLTAVDLRLRLLSRDGMLQDAVVALESGLNVEPMTYASLLQSCIDSDSISLGRRLHAKISAIPEPNAFVETKLVSMYAKCGSLEEARRMFDRMRERNLFAWSAMIGGCVRERRWEEAMELFFQMMLEGVTPDGFLLPKILQACANSTDAETGRLLHSVAVRGGFLASLVEAYVGNSILAMYAKCGELESARRFFEKMSTKDRVTWNAIIYGYCLCGENDETLRLFERMEAEGIKPGPVTWNTLITSCHRSANPDLAMHLMKKMVDSGLVPDVVTWTGMISGFAQNKRTNQALDLFQDMQLVGVEPNGMTFASVISACASLKALRKGKELHCFVIKSGYKGNVLVGNSLVDMYAKCERLEDAERVFDAILERDVFSCNSMIAGYAQAGYCGKAHDLFSKMEDSGVRRNVVTWNAMVSGYMQNGDEDQAMELFQRMETNGIGRNTASWNLLIAGLLQIGLKNKALGIFRQMQSHCTKLNSVTILSILPACTNLVSACKVQEIHAYVLRTGLQFEIAISNSLIDAYAKSGSITNAQSIFHGLSSGKDVISWNTLIAGYVLHGLPEMAVDLFSQMKQEKAKPNQSTFARILYAFGNLGLVNEGRKLFSSMTDEYQIIPGSEHYAAMVDLLGRSCGLQEAWNFIEKMPIEPDSTIWSALLTACRHYGNKRLAEVAAGHLSKLEPWNSVIHNLLLQIRTLNGRSNDASKVLMYQKRHKNEESIGSCWTEVNNKVHAFVTGDKSMFNSERLHATLACIEEVKLARPDFSYTPLKIEEEEEEMIAGVHSEKLAMAFALISLPNFRSIRVIKSPRMCMDCHATAKFVSKAYQREVLVKDTKLLHHFIDGQCSCRDYW